jgi:hypothetical protein
MLKQSSQIGVITISRVFFRLAVPALFSLFLALFPTTIPAQPVPPGDVELEGTLEVLHEDRDPGSRFIYYLRTAIERLELRFAADAPALQTGDHIRARGVRSNGVLALSSGDSVQTLAAALPNTFGGQKTILILVNFYDKATQPYSVATAQSVMNTTSNFDMENSFTQAWLTGVVDPASSADVYGWFTINQSYTVCNYSTLASLAEQAAIAAGANMSLYTRRVYAFPSNACTWWGLGTVGGNPSKAWVNGSFQLRVVGHEMGHNLGLYHSHFMSCASGTCTTSDYGDGWDIMGSSSGHYNAFQKERLGWLEYNISPPIATVSADGVYWIAPYELNDSDPKALKIFKSIDPSTGRQTYYYVEYRAGLGFDSSLSKAVILHTGTESSGNSSYIWDLDQVTTTSDWVLNVGQSYSDPTAGVTIALLSMDSTGATVSVTFGGGGTTCVQSSPTATLSPSSQSTTVGSSVSYTMTVTNNNSSGCTASGFNLGAAMPSGLTASFGSSSLSIAPGSNASTNLTVSSSSSLSSGTYSFTATGTNSTSTSYSGSATGVDTLVAPTSISVSVSTDKSSYNRNQSVTITATVNSSGSPVSGASVNFTITKANGSLVSGSATTASNGAAVYNYRVKPKDPVGTYQVKADASLSGVSGSVTTSFIVQ